MDGIDSIRLANYLKRTAMYSLFILGTLVFVFALLSGAEQYGGGMNGIIRNSPNAAPWLLLILLVLIAAKRELIGGILLTLFGCAAIYYFNFSGSNFWWSVFILTILVTILGSFFIFSWLLKRSSGKSS